MKAPILIREARVWLKCPEIRRQVGRGMLYRAAWLVLSVPFVCVALPLELAARLFAFLADGLNDVSEAFGAPLRALHSRRQESIYAAHQTMSPKDIRSRLGESA